MSRVLAFPPAFPALEAPAPPTISWPASVLFGYQVVSDKYERYLATLRLDDGNLGRLRSLYHSIQSDLLPLWLNLEASGLSNLLVEQGLDCLAHLFVCIGEVVDVLQVKYAFGNGSMVFTGADYSAAKIRYLREYQR
jgi:hypothetical protein